MLASLAALLVAGSIWCVIPSPPSARLHRGADTTAPGGRLRRDWLAQTIEDRRRRAFACAIGVAVSGWALSGPLGAAVGLVCGAALAEWIGRLEPPAATRRREQVDRDLPLAIDLFAACAAVGHPVDRALGVVAGAVGGPLAARFEELLARLALGADPLTEWQHLAADQQLAPLARTMVRALESGAALVTGLSRLADDSRRVRRTSTQLKARSVGVKAAGPLAVCFLPAFMLIGVVPTVAGAFSSLVR